MKDMHTGITAVQEVLPQVVTTGGGAVTTGDVDLQGANAAEVLTHFGAPGDTLSGSVYFTVKAEHADDDGTGAAGAYADCATADLLGVTAASGIVHTINADAEASQVYKFGYKGNKRFLKVTVTPTSGHTTGTPIAVTIIKGHLSVSN